MLPSIEHHEPITMDNEYESYNEMGNLMSNITPALNVM